jgi:hypothetical protein
MIHADSSRYHISLLYVYDFFWYKWNGNEILLFKKYHIYIQRIWIILVFPFKLPLISVLIKIPRDFTKFLFIFHRYATHGYAYPCGAYPKMDPLELHHGYAYPHHMNHAQLDIGPEVRVATVGTCQEKPLLSQWWFSTVSQKRKIVI